MVEAVASELATFVNDWVTMREITDNGKLARLYMSKDPADLLRVFMVSLRNRAAYERETVVNAKVIREKFSIERHMEALKRVYDEV